MSDTPRTDKREKVYWKIPTLQVSDVWKFARELERENAALKQALDAQVDYQRELRADRDRLDWLLTCEGRTWFCQKLDSGEWIESMGDARGFIDSAMGVYHEKQH